MKLNQKLNSLEEEVENDELWAISYGDMITLLLSFFVIYFSTDFKKNEKEKIDQHLITNFKYLDLSDSKPRKVNTKSFDKKGTSSYPNFELLKNAQIRKINDRLVVHFENMNIYESASPTPNKNGEEMLAAFAQKFVPYAGIYKISVKAFTDNRPVLAKYRYKDNMELSALRAVAALRILQKHGIPLSRLEIAGYGEMNKLSQFIPEEKLKKMDKKAIESISRTVILIIKHDNEQSLL